MILNQYYNSLSIIQNQERLTRPIQINSSIELIRMTMKVAAMMIILFYSADYLSM